MDVPSQKWDEWTVDDCKSSVASHLFPAFAELELAPGPRNPREREYPGGCRGVTGPVPLPLLMKASEGYVSLLRGVNIKPLGSCRISATAKLASVDSAESEFHLKLPWGQANVFVKCLGERALIAKSKVLRHIPNQRPFVLQRLARSLNSQF